MDTELKRDIERFAEENSVAIFRDIARLVAIDSVEGDAMPGAPFGAGPARALTEALELSRELGLEAVDCEGKIGYAAIGGKGERYLATITHLDVVPTGDGWSEDPFSMREREGYIIGRGVMDDKGPTVLCLYALKYLKERGTELKYPVRALLGINEETGMEDVRYYLENYPAPLFCFSPDANFPLCNGEKGIYHGKINALHGCENILDISGGVAANVIPDKARATVRAEGLRSAGRVKAEELEPGIWGLEATGIGGHASQPRGTVNAIGELVEYILENRIAGEGERAFLELISLLHRAWDGSALGIRCEDEAFGALTIVGGVIGIRDGRIYQTVDCRYPTVICGEQISAAINENAAGTAEITAVNDNPPFYMALDNPAVQVCINAYNSMTGEDAKPYTIGGGTYARHFPNAVSFGPEHPERPQPDFAGPIHGVDEAASKAHFIEALKVYILALLELEKLEF